MLIELRSPRVATRPYGILRLVTSHGDVENPRWSFVEEMVRTLDGVHASLLILETSSGAEVCMGGGRDGVLAVSGSEDGVHFFKTRRPPSPPSPVVIACGGQELTFDWTECVRRDEALCIARIFYVTGRLHPEFEWVEEGAPPSTTSTGALPPVPGDDRSPTADR